MVTLVLRFPYISLSLLLLLTGCGYYTEKNPPDPSTITEVSWAKMQAEFFGPRCNICHGDGGAGINTASYEDVKSKIARIQSECLGTRKRMPPDSPLTSHESTLLLDWINKGTPITPVSVP